MTEYKIFSCEGGNYWRVKTALEEQVLRLIEEGWQPLGAACCTRMLEWLIWHQTLIRESVIAEQAP